LIINNYITDSPFHQALYHSTHLLGIKPIDRTKEIEVFAVKNEIWLEATKHFGKLLEVGTEELAFSSENHSWACYFLGDLYKIDLEPHLILAKKMNEAGFKCLEYLPFIL
jgi:predicted nucleotide-binding protein (sugar kinase/HSP70/actin superfamily)